MSVADTCSERLGDQLDPHLAAADPLLAAIWIFVMRRMRGGAGGLEQMMSFGKHKATRLAPDLPKVGFQGRSRRRRGGRGAAGDHGVSRGPAALPRARRPHPQGVLLCGRPAPARPCSPAVAGETGVPFFSIAGSDFVEMFVGVGASRVRDLFKEAKVAAPCIVFGVSSQAWTALPEAESGGRVTAGTDLSLGEPAAVLQAA